MLKTVQYHVATHGGIFCIHNPSTLGVCEPGEVHRHKDAPRERLGGHHVPVFSLPLSINSSFPLFRLPLSPAPPGVPLDKVDTYVCCCCIPQPLFWGSCLPLSGFFRDCLATATLVESYHESRSFVTLLFPIFGLKIRLRHSSPGTRLSCPTFLEFHLISLLTSCRSQLRLPRHLSLLCTTDFSPQGRKYFRALVCIHTRMKFHPVNVFSPLA